MGRRFLGRARVRAKTPRCIHGVPASIGSLALTPLTGSAPLAAVGRAHLTNRKPSGPKPGQPEADRLERRSTDLISRFEGAFQPPMPRVQGKDF